MDPPSMPPPPPPPATDDVAGAHSAATMETPESKKRVRQPRNSACEKCASLKMKCVRNAEGERCERCTRMGLECIASVPKPRKRREGEFIASHASHGSGTIAADAAVDTLSTPTRDSRTLPSPVTKLPFISDGANVPADSLLSRGDLHHTGSKTFVALLAQSLEVDQLHPSNSDLLRGIDANAIVHACTVFRQCSAYFPFVTLPLRIDAVNMALQRPMTTLAVYTVTAAADRDRQERSSHLFRLAFAAQAVVKGKCNVDLLAGLLIYLAWNHHYMASHQIYQYLCLLSGMTADLGLYQSPPRADVKDPTMAAESDRAFVGAYFLCSLVPAFAFNKHSPMRWTDNLRTCADNIAQAGEFQSDRALASLLELAVSVDDFQTALQTNFKTATSRQHTQLQAKTAGQRLRALRRDHASLANNAILAACAVDVQYKQSHYTDSPDPSIMIQCACSAKEYFDDLLSRPPSFLHQVAIVDWICLLHVVVLMARLSKQAAGATGWEHGALTSMLQPEQTLEKLLNHMASAPASDPLAPRHDGLLRWLHSFAQSTKSALLAGDAARQMEGTDGRFRPMNSEPVPLADRPLPYQAQDRSANVQMRGVLDSDFWSGVANGG